MKSTLAVVSIALTWVACSGRRLPPGTPPPEYEPPQIVPWAAENADAGSDASARREEQTPAPPAAAPELSLDAGPR